jgi:ribosome-associated protein
MAIEMAALKAGLRVRGLVAAGEVKVDGAVELRKRAKIRSGQVVEYKGQKVKVL